MAGKLKVGVCLSGCGVFDGSEIHEAVVTLLALDRAGAEARCMAPDATLEVVDHRTQQPTGEKRSVLAESARIARGDIVDVARVRAKDIDALIFPGGFGAAKNLSDFASAGPKAKAHPDVARLVRDLLAAKKPIGAICIAPGLLAAVLRDAGVKAKLTIGNERETASAIEAMGCTHERCPVDDFVVDETNKIVSTPAYMLAGGIAEAASGIKRLVAEVLRLVPQKARV
jgi:enhancing lycopene biosynthesis protein 2